MPIDQTRCIETTGENSRQSSRPSMQVVSFRLGDEQYGIEILRVQEIIRVPELTRVPNSPSVVEGVINLRGKVIPIVGLRKRFGLATRAKDKETRIIVIDSGGEAMGFEVDSVSEVLRIPIEAIEPPPRLSRCDNEFVSGVAKLHDRLLLLLDVNRLTTAETSSAAASQPKATLVEVTISSPEEALLS